MKKFLAVALLLAAGLAVGCKPKEEAATTSTATTPPAAEAPPAETPAP